MSKLNVIKELLQGDPLLLQWNWLQLGFSGGPVGAAIHSK